MKLIGAWIMKYVNIKETRMLNALYDSEVQYIRNVI